jgi:hypothetical protein
MAGRVEITALQFRIPTVERASRNGLCSIAFARGITGSRFVDQVVAL